MFGFGRSIFLILLSSPHCETMLLFVCVPLLEPQLRPNVVEVVKYLENKPEGNALAFTWCSVLQHEQVGELSKDATVSSLQGIQCQ